MKLSVFFAAVFLLVVRQGEPAKGYTYSAWSWDFYKNLMGKNEFRYCPGEEDMRQKIHEVNTLRSYEFNSRENATWVHRWNIFSDMTFDEWYESTKEIDEDQNDDGVEKFEFEMDDKMAAPASFDWRSNGVTFQIRDQGNCASSYAIAAVNAVEAHYNIRTFENITLATQELLDCVPSGTKSCQGGSVKRAFDFIMDNKGLSTADEYVDHGRQNTICTAYLYHRVDLVLERIYQGSSSDEEVLKKVVSSMGPVVTRMDISHESFMRYGSGIYEEPECTHNTNHAVLVVGYGSDEGKDYWIIQNTMGTKWGDFGFMKIARNKNNHCGIGLKYWWPQLG